jgi:hypothetical protein
VASVSPAAPEPLQGPSADQPLHRLGGAAERGADHEHHDRNLEDDLASEQVPELPDDRRDDGLREQIGGDHPRLVSRRAEITDDRRQCRRDDCLVERRQQHSEHDGREDDVLGGAVEDRGTAGRLQVRGGRGHPGR